MGVLCVFGVWFGGVGLCFRGGFRVFWLCWGTFLLLFVLHFWGMFVIAMV